MWEHLSEIYKLCDAAHYGKAAVVIDGYDYWPSTMANTHLAESVSNDRCTHHRTNE